MKIRQHLSGRSVLTLGSLLAAATMLLGYSQSVCAQWSTSGTNVYYNGGNVGIGTSSPGDRLVVEKSSAESAITINADAAQQATFYLSSAGTKKSAIYRPANSNDLRFNIVGIGDALTMQSSNGNVGIGTTSPSQKLEVNGGIKLTNGNDTFLSNNNVLGLHSNGYMYFQGGPNGAIFASDNVRNEQIILRSASAGSKIDFVTGSAVKMTLDSGGNLSVSGNIAAKYQDVAEWVPASEQLPAGTVVVLDSTKSNQVISSSEAYDTRVAGVISAQPGIALGEGGPGKVLVATTGRVLVQVDASKRPIHIGDLLVTSDIPGIAMKSEPIKVGGRLMHMPGTLIGKALEPLEKGSGKILVLLSLQ